VLTGTGTVPKQAFRLLSSRRAALTAASRRYEPRSSRTRAAAPVPQEVG
jgi:hypothetical protein